MTSATICCGWCSSRAIPCSSTEARVALTLRLLGGLTAGEIARAFLVSEPTIAQRIVRAKTNARRGERAVRGPARRRVRRPPVVGASGDLPRLQRGLLGDRRRRLAAAGALRRRASPRPHSGRPDASGARSPRPRRADGDPGVALGRACRAGRRAHPAARSEPRALGSRAHRPWPGGARARGAARRHARSVHASGRDCRLPRSSAHAEETDWAGIAGLYDKLAELDAVAGRGIESCGGARRWRLVRPRVSTSSTR